MLDEFQYYKYPAVWLLQAPARGKELIRSHAHTWWLQHINISVVSSIFIYADLSHTSSKYYAVENIKRKLGSLWNVGIQDLSNIVHAYTSIWEGNSSIMRYIGLIHSLCLYMPWLTMLMRTFHKPKINI